ncbi:MAG: hypothetical protein HY907_16695 [Deltaproteobacteria bacterium]|nr:hypothetical protein [Deltaproteobacteria bacterium]
MLDVALVRTGRRTPILALACPTPEQQQRAFNVPDENIADRRITPGFFPDDAPIRMSASGHRALVVLPRGEVAGFAPNRPPRRFRPRAGETVVATGWHKSYLLAVTRDKTLFRLWLAPRGAGGMPANQIAVLDVPVLLEHLPSVGQVWANHDRTKWLVAGEGWGWIADRQAGQVTSIEGQVLGHGASNRAYVFIVLDPDGTVRMRGSGIAPQPVGRAPVRRALLTLPGGDATSAFVALNVADRVWRVVRCWRGSTVIELTEPPGIRLVGFQPSKREVGLLVLEPDQRTFSVVGRSASRVLHVHETGPVGTMALAQSGQAFAYLAGGELHVISSGGRRLLRERGNPP